jgi:hypothetical protein
MSKGPWAHVLMLMQVARSVLTSDIVVFHYNGG